MGLDTSIIRYAKIEALVGVIMNVERRITVKHDHTDQIVHLVFFPTHGNTWRIYLDTNEDEEGPARPVNWTPVIGYRFSGADDMIEFLNQRDWKIINYKGPKEDGPGSGLDADA